jgi:hypothetical protein
MIVCPTLVLASTISDIDQGYLFVDECPYAISSIEEAFQDGPTNTVELVEFAGGRLGNKFMTLKSHLSKGYCCRSKLTILPETAHDFPASYGKKSFYAGKHLFDFSSAELPEIYRHLGDDPSICTPEMSSSGRQAFQNAYVHKDLLECMDHVFVRGCEKEYMGSIVDVDEGCPFKTRERDGLLVLPIRSGDIFKDSAWNAFGQPPLQYYLDAIYAKDWDEVHIVTSFANYAHANPVYSILKTMKNSGALGENIELFEDRSLKKDLEDMICADAIGISMSSLSFLTLAHTRAETVFFPCECGAELPRSKKKYFEFADTTLFMREKPNSEVYGIRLDPMYPMYSVYSNWTNSAEQLLEMLTYNGITEIEMC